MVRQRPRLTLKRRQNIRAMIKRKTELAAQRRAAAEESALLSSSPGNSNPNFETSGTSVNTAEGTFTGKREPDDPNENGYWRSGEDGDGDAPHHESQGMSSNSASTAIHADSFNQSHPNPSKSTTHFYGQDLKPERDMLMEQDEPEVPVTFDDLRKLKKTTRVRVSSELQGTKLLKATPVTANCFICLARFKSGARTTARSSNVCTFLLETLLSIPLQMRTKLLKQFGNFDDWIHLCWTCKQRVISCITAKQQIDALRDHIEKEKCSVVEKIRGISDLPVSTNGDESGGYPTEALNEIKNFLETAVSKDVLSDQSDEECPIQEDDNDEDPLNLEHSPGDKVFSDQLSQSNNQNSEFVELYCGLCNDKKVYLSEDLLILHTRKAHPPPPPKIIKLQENLGATPTEVEEEEKSKPIAKNTEAENADDDPVLYSCPNCPKLKSYPILKYIQHLRIHRKRPYQCSKCHRLFPHNEELWKQHWDEHHTSKKFKAEKFRNKQFDAGKVWQCEYCEAWFPTEEERNEHESKHINIGSKSTKDPNPTHCPYPCSYCHKTLRCMDEWRFHRIIEHPDMDANRCYHCDESFMENTLEGLEVISETKMMSHMINRHEKELGRKACGGLHIDCEECGIVFSQHRSHGHFEKAQHERTVHKNPGWTALRCQICKKNFKNRKQLKSHMTMVHFIRERSMCDICGATFLMPGAVSGHKFLEHGLNPEQLPVLTCSEEGCDFKCVWKYHLWHHVINKHKPRSHLCKQCGKSFGDTHKLKRHELIHDNKNSKPYKCDICGNSFAVRNYLYIHKQLQKGRQMS